MFNKVEIIGVVTSVNDNEIILQTEKNGSIKFLFQEKINVDAIEIGEVTKVVGHLDGTLFPFAVAIVDEIYQIRKDSIS